MGGGSQECAAGWLDNCKSSICSFDVSHPSVVSRTGHSQVGIDALVSGQRLNEHRTTIAQPHHLPTVTEAGDNHHLDFAAQESKPWLATSKSMDPLFMLQELSNGISMQGDSNGILASFAGSASNNMSRMLPSEDVKLQTTEPKWNELKPVVSKSLTSISRTATELNKATAGSARRVLKSGLKDAYTPPLSLPLGNGSATDLELNVEASWRAESSDCSRDLKKCGRDRSLASRSIASKNLVSERKRRKKLNEGLYSLRALVPKISKMDKASIIGDAVNYVQELKKEVEEMENLENSNLESECCGSVGDDSGSIITDIAGDDAAGITVINLYDGNTGEPAKAASLAGADVTDHKPSSTTKTENSPSQLCSGKKKILHVEVARLEEQTYHLRILCQKGHRVLVQLMQALESLGIDVVNAHHTSLQDNILNTFVAQIKNWEMMETEEVRQKLLGVAAQYGLVQT